jgi:hypothetical protein
VQEQGRIVDENSDNNSVNLANSANIINPVVSSVKLIAAGPRNEWLLTKT